MAEPEPAPAPAAGALGFYTFKLWSVVTSVRRPLTPTLLLVVVLVCVGAAVVKRLFMGELVLALVCEVHSAAMAMERVLKLLGTDLQGGCVPASPHRIRLRWQGIVLPLERRG